MKYGFIIAVCLALGGSFEAMAQQTGERGQYEAQNREQAKAALRLLITSGVIKVKPNGRVAIDSDFIQDLRDEGLLSSGTFEVCSICIEKTK